ncbi:MAG: AAA family ATPase [Myxococcota bacterium]|nr:AAA family ATPase [Myxococcota bacterium]
MGRTIDFQGFVQSVELVRDNIPSFDAYPFSVPAIRGLDKLALDPKITFIVGENGSGKSTLIEAIAVAAGFNAEGGSSNFAFSTRRSESPLHGHVRLARGLRRPRTDFFLRAESYFNVATEIERLDAEPLGGDPIIDAYGGVSLHEQSHGESFMALVKHRFGPNGFYILDEPESALSPQRQLSLLAILHRLVSANCQFIIATHSPILMAYPDASIFHLSSDGIRSVAYEDTEHYGITRDFLNHRERFFKHLFDDQDPTPE